MIAVLASLLLATQAPEPTPAPQTLVFYNARLALKDRLPSDALRWWLLRNSLRQAGQRSPHDAEFRSVVWAALGELGLCPDGFPRDDDGGAKLYALALHNQVVVASVRGEPPDQSAPFESFEVARQQRFISLHDVLDLSELRTAAFFPTTCAAPNSVLLEFDLPPAGLLTDRLQLGGVLRSLLEHALTTLVREKVTSVAVIEARLFDLNLELARLEALQARQAALLLAQKAASKGASKVAVTQVQAQGDAFSPTAPQGVFLRKALAWRTDEWLALSRERRLALFVRARKYAPSPEARDALALRLIDALIDQKAGSEIEAWISLFEADAGRRRQALVDGERGKRLLELDPTTGFRERGPIALARGVLLLERGDRREALRSFAAALRAAGDSHDQTATASLARRWLSYVLGSFETNDEVIATLKALVPSLEYNAVIEDLVWKAALRADGASFERLVASARRGGSFDGRVALLRPLSQGKAGALVDQLVQSATDQPHALLRFVNQLLERVETEDLEVRRALTPLLRALSRALDAVSAQSNVSKAQVRKAEELSQRNQAILTGLGQFEDSTASRARSLAPGQAAFAGNVRLAPADPLPWPFPLIEPIAPSPFRALVLEPLEWRDAAGTLVFGWRLSE